MDEWLRARREELQAQVVNVRSDMTHTRPLYFTTRRCTYSDVVSVVTTTHANAGRVPARRNKELRKIKVPLTSATFVSPLRNSNAIDDEERQRRNEALWAENSKFMAALGEKRERRARAEVYAAIRIEAIYRGHLVRKAAAVIATRCRIQKKLRALMKAQTVDMVLDDEQMRQKVRTRWNNAAVEVQRRYRGCLGMRVAAKEGVLRQHELLRNASRAIQCAARRRLCVLAVRLEMAHERHLKTMFYARKIQCKFRSMRARDAVQSKRTEKESACATILQRSHRRFLTRGVLALKKKQVRDAEEDAGAKRIQRALRCARARRYVAVLRADLESAQLHSAATKLQSAYRGHLGERHAEAVVQAQAEEQVLVAVLHIQRIGRGWISRQRVTELRDDRSFDIFVQARLGDGDQVDDLFNGVVAADEKHSTTEEDAGGNTILLIAARWGHKKIARKCLRWEFGIDHENHDGLTALQLAIRHRHDEVAAYLIEKQARFQTTGRTALHEASANGLVATVTELLAREVHPSTLDDDLRTPLHETAGSGASSETLQLLLKHDAVVNAPDRDELTPLHRAAAGGHLAALNALLEASADVTLRDAEGQLAWHHALAGGHDSCAALLRERWLNATGQEAIEMSTAADNVAALRGAAAGDRLAVEGFVDSGVPLQATDEASGNTLLHLAASSGNNELVDFLLKRGADDMATNAAGQVPLHLGATHDLVARRLLQQSSAIERALPMQDGSGRTPMHVAARAGLVFDEAMRSLPTAVKLGELVDNDGRTVLHDAARCPSAASKKACCSSLLKLGVPPSAVDQQGRSALHIASLTDEGALCICQLARTKAHLEARDNAGRTALHIAAQHGCAAVVHELLSGCEHAADAASVDKRCRSAAYYALRAGAIMCFRELAAATKIDVKARDSDGLTLLWAALRSRSSPCVREMLERGSDQVEMYPASGDSPLHVACRYGFTDGVYQLLGAGVLPAALNARNKAGRTPLGEAVHGGYVDAAKALLENGADAKAAPDDGRTYMHAAADADVPSAGMLSLLLDVGGLKVDATDADGNTPLHIAARSLAFDGPVRVKLLAINGADVDTITKNAASCTPLHLAAAAGASDNVKMLLELGANATAVDTSGCTALDMAGAAGAVRCIEALKT